MIVRDGRPFGPDPGARATSLPFPFPSTIAGGVRTRAGLNEDGIFKYTRDDKKELEHLKRLRVRGPLLVQLTSDGGDIASDKWLVPTPRDALLLPPKLTLAGEPTTLIQQLVPLELPEGAATSLMTLGAYKAAESCAKYQDASVRCWYLDTANTHVIPLVGKGRDNSIFSITVDQYVAAYNYRLQDASNIKNYRQCHLKEDWKAFARRLGKNPQAANLLKQVLIGSSRTAKRVVKSIEIHKFLQDLEAIGLVNKLREDGIDLHFTLSEEQYKFLDGAWLELYVYQEAKDLELFDNVQWSKEIIDNDPDRTAKFPLQYKDMDVSLTYKARLIIVECKTGKKGLESEPLDDIVTIADLIGRGFVVKILVTSQSLPDLMDANQQASHKDFLTKAKRKGVFVVTQERLPQVGSILEEQAKISAGR